MRPCTSRRCGWRRVPYATSWASTWVKAYSRSGKRVASWRNPADWRWGEAATDTRVGRVRDLVQQSEWDVGPDDRSRLQQALFIARQAIDARRQERVHTRWDPDGGDRLREAIRSRRSHEDLRLHQGPDAFLEEQRVPFRSLHEQALEARSRPPAGHGGIPRPPRGAAHRPGSACSGPGVQPQPPPSADPWEPVLILRLPESVPAHSGPCLGCAVRRWVLARASGERRERPRTC
jgi:hypothetical protein